MSDHGAHAGHLPRPSADKARRRATLAALAVSGTLFVVKFFAWRMTGSVAVLGSTLDSMLDVLGSALTFFAVRHALNPPDHEHRFGHGKAEALAGLARSLLVLSSGIFVGWEAVGRLVNPVSLSDQSVAVIVMVVSILLSAALALYQYRVYRATRSVAVGADAANYGADVLVSLGVLIAIWLAQDERFAIADPLFGFAMAVIIGVSAWTIVIQSYDQLMDREMTDLHRERIKEIVLSHPQAHGIHDLRTRRSGADLFIQFHLELDPDITLREAHTIADEVEVMVATAYPDADVIAHQEPVGEFIESDFVRT